MDLIETVGARLVLMGRAEYLAGLTEAKKALGEMGAASSEAAAGSAELTAAQIKEEAAQRTLADTTKAAVKAQLDYEAALKEAADADKAAAAGSDEVAAARKRESDAAVIATKATRDAALAQVQDAKTAKAEAVASADQVAAAETRKGEAAVAASGAMKTASVGAIAAVAAVGFESVKMATDFQTQMTRLYTAAGAPKQAILDSYGTVLQIGTSVGQTGTAMAEALYHPISAGLDLASSLEVVKYAGQEAAISGASLEDTTYSLSSVMKAFNMPADQAGQAMADLNAIVGQGDMRFQDLNDSIKNWAPTAAQMGISIDSMGAGLAYLTDRGNDATTASTRLTMGISMMTTPSAQAAKMLEGLGVASSDVQASSQAMRDALAKAHITQNDLAKDLQQPDGLYVALNHLKTALEAAGVSGTEADSVLAKIFGGGRSDKAIMSLMQNLDGLKTKFQDISTASTPQAFQSAWDGAQQTVAFQAKQLGVTFENLGISIGTKLLPAVSKFLQAINEGIGWLKAHQEAAQALGDVLIGVLTVGALMLASALATKVVDAIKLVGVALKAMSTGNWIMLVIGLLVMGALLVIQHWDQVKAFFIGIWNAIYPALKPVIDAVVSAWDWVKNATVTAWNWCVGVVKTVIDGIISFFQPLVDAVRSHWDEIKQVTNVLTGFLEAAFTPVWIAIKIVWGLIVGVLQGTWDVIVALFKFSISIVWTALQVGWDIIKGAVIFTWDLIKTILQGAWDFIVGVFNVARDIIVGIITVFLDLITGHWSRAWTDIKDFASKIWNDIVSAVTKYFSDLWDNVKRIAGDMWDGLKQIFTDLWHDLLGVFARGANLVIGVINGFLDIVNKVAGAIGFSINLHIDPIPGYEIGGVLPGSGGGVPMLASGGVSGMDFGTVGSGFMTNGPRAIVGEGNPLYPEYVIPTDPTHRGRALGLLQSLMGDIGYEQGGALPAGVPQYSVGGIIGGIWSGITSAASSVAHGFDAAVDWVGNAAKEGIRKVVEDVWPALDVPANSFAGLVPATLNYWRNKALDWIDGKYQAQQAAAAAATGTAGSPAQVQAWVAQALQMMGLSPSLEPGILNIIMHESGGNPSAINLWDSNAKAGHPSQGLMQTIPSTFAAYVLPSLAGRPITDPIANITAGVRYALANYGFAWLASGGNRSASGGYLGYASGGVLPIAGARMNGGPVTGGWPYLVGEGGPELFVPGTDGHIVPNGMTPDIGGDWGTGGGGIALGTTVHVHPGAIVVNEATDPRASYEAVKQGIADAVARA